MDTQKTWFQYFKECITKKYFTFSGRASRTEFFSFMLISTTIVQLSRLMSSYLNLTIEVNQLHYKISAFLTLFFFIPRMTLAARRFHDIGKSHVLPVIIGVLYLLWTIISNLFFHNVNMPTSSNTYIFLILIPLSIYFIYYAFKKGHLGTNKYGPDPLNPKLEDELDQLGKE